ncbi:lymphocyte antigen 6E-like [Halichoeres trimaculatus]|uniref:lymphocyte antigen 6E-like n=1 Tax=Halichoeres trimaculatus TaxID=147232 RepID=UPI003D9E8473
MRAFQFAVLLLIVCISCAEALRCNYCVSGRPGVPCTNTVKECGRQEDVCVSVMIGSPAYSYFRRCSRRVDAGIMKANDYLTVHICDTDRCN